MRRFSFLASAVFFLAPAAAATAPVDTSPPTIDGVPRQSQTLTALSAWSGDGEIDYAYQWQRCDASGATCAAIAGATAQSYVLAAADVGATLRVVVTATNAGGSTSATSGPTAIVRAPPAAPIVSVLPSVTGDAVVGSALSAQSGSWNGDAPISYAYQWQRCALSGGACQNIGAATGAAYTAAPADSGKQLRVQVTATNDVSSNPAVSGLTDIVTGGPKAPSNTKAPAVAGPARVGQTLTASTGVWSGSPPFTFLYQWQRCAANGTGCENVAAGTGPTYTLVAADNGRTLAVVVTALTTGGAGRARSSVTALVSGGDTRPVNTALPAIAGSAEVGQTLSVTTGSWVGNAPLTYAYQWQRCVQSGACESVAGATSATYQLGGADRGTAFRAVVTATNAVGSTSATSGRSAPVAAADSLGAVVLGDGRTSVPAAALAVPDRLTLIGAQFSPAVLRSHARFSVRLRVGDLHGRVVRGALVAVSLVPADAAAAATPARTTGVNGWVAFTLRPSPALELRPGALALFVRLSRLGESGPAGVSNQQLVTAPIGRPRP